LDWLAITGYATVAAPLHDLTKKDVTFVWSPKAQTAFVTLKEALTSPPVLAMPNDNGEIVLDTDACEKSIGSVLSHAGRIMSKQEVNYCISRKQLLQWHIL